MSNTNNPLQPRYILNPVYWPTWLGLGFLWLSTKLPYKYILLLGKVMGSISYVLLAERRRITRINIGLCFPQLSKKEQRRLIRESFYSSGMALFESALCWWGSDEKVKPLMHIEGLENLKQAEEKGHGVIMLGGHYTMLEVGGRLMSYYTDKVIPTYKSARNKLFEAVMADARKRISHDLIKSLDMRGVVRALKKKKIIWYAPDQDFGYVKTSVFAPFMGTEAISLTFTSRLAKATGAPVVPWYIERLPDLRGYKVTLGPALENFPGGDDVRDATIINNMISQHVEKVPEQYLWGHRRFKTRPAGSPPIYRPRRGKQMRRYSLLLFALTIPALIYSIINAIRYKNCKFFTERMGIGSYAKNVDFWIHAASVGEINAVAPLIDLLKQNHPDCIVMLTTNTPTGYQNAQIKFDNVAIHFLPFDWMWAVKRFIHRTDPNCTLIFETELWPNLYEYSYWRGKNLTIINARLSHRSLDSSGWRRYLFSLCVQYTHRILARSERDKESFMKLTASEEQIKVVGNIKWASRKKTTPEPLHLAKKYVLLASSRDGEEKLLCQTLSNLVTNKNYLLTIVPRHPQRLQDILTDLKDLDLKIAVRSLNQPVNDNTQIYIADTFGELEQFIAGSELVIMGGSFVPKGGQNIIEVARQGKAVIFGPHMDNFDNEATLFLQHQAGFQTNIDSLENTVTMLLTDNQLCLATGNNALKLVEQNQDMAKRYYDEIIQICGPCKH